MHRTLLGTIAAMAAAVTIFIVYVAMNFNITGNCEEQLLSQYPSPDGNRTALVALHACGATVPYYTSVTIKGRGENLRPADDFVFSVKGKNNIQVVWEEVWNPNRPHYTIVYDRPDRIERQITVWRGEQISYRER